MSSFVVIDLPTQHLFFKNKNIFQPGKRDIAFPVSPGYLNVRAGKSFNDSYFWEFALVLENDCVIRTGYSPYIEMNTNI